MFSKPKIAPVITAVAKDFNIIRIIASLFEKSASNNLYTTIPAKRPADTDKKVILK